jgi:hypothetical protein
MTKVEGRLYGYTHSRLANLDCRRDRLTGYAGLKKRLPCRLDARARLAPAINAETARHKRVLRTL